MITRIKRKIKQLKWLYDLKIVNHCKIDKGAYIDQSCVLEGYNRFSRGVKLIDCEIGKGTYFNTDTKFIKVSIGRFCSIGSNVRVINGRHPTSNFVSTHPAFFSDKKQAGFTYVNRSKFEEYRSVNGRYYSLIGNDVWVGTDVRIMGGITIGDGAIIAAGAIVTKNVPPYAIVGGVPAHIIRYRFDDDQIKKLLRIQWWDKDEKWIKDHAESFEDIDKFLIKVEGETTEC